MSNIPPKFYLSDRTRMISGPGYYSDIDLSTGFFRRMGVSQDKDAVWCQYGPELLDIEVTTSCKGVPDVTGKYSVCKHCYKSNNPAGRNMSLDVFKKILSIVPKTVGQIAFGADSQALSNPDLPEMMRLCREQHIVPNITVADITSVTAAWLASICGAVAVSRYSNPEPCYNSVHLLARHGMKQVNIHMMIAEETYEQSLQLIKDVKTDSRLVNLNAVVFLSLKQKGRGINYHPLAADKFANLIGEALKNNVRIGFDSCSTHKFLKAVQDNKDIWKLDQKLIDIMVEPCESSIFSLYINTDGIIYPCSFTEEGEGINVQDVTDFVIDVWKHPRLIKFRQQLLRCKRHCPVYNI